MNTTNTNKEKAMTTYHFTSILGGIDQPGLGLTTTITIHAETFAAAAAAWQEILSPNMWGTVEIYDGDGPLIFEASPGPLPCWIPLTPEDEAGDYPDLLPYLIAGYNPA